MSELIVLDSHIWYWWINLENERLSPTLVDDIETAPRVGVSAVSCFELALAHRRGRLALPQPPAEWLRHALAGSGVELLPLTPEIAARAVTLTEVHRDPFDRIIIATALEYDARLASLDGLFANYPELSSRLVPAATSK
ncbi:MAG: type II toxin-antitoxin system VapC family toxin [Gammaproteobacteria bacterium]|nr:type II toxin-antitoxin system VapC family toxin [Gammaproteobacteria bacterium]MCP5458287.1 type II toxin-antitoxin system VapC family toxin [Gammaproteobacteria bacterium]